MIIKSCHQVWDAVHKGHVYDHYGQTSEAACAKLANCAKGLLLYRLKRGGCSSFNQWGDHNLNLLKKKKLKALFQNVTLNHSHACNKTSYKSVRNKC
jgi:hypothetical protein